MAIRWDWEEDYCGYLEFPVEVKGEGEIPNIVRLYRGNAFLFGLFEDYAGETYRMCYFLTDKEHAKRFFGKTKEFDYAYFPFSIHQGGQKEYVNPTRVCLDPDKFSPAEISLITTLFVECPDHVPVQWCKPVRLKEEIISQNAEGGETS